MSLKKLLIDAAAALSLVVAWAVTHLPAPSAMPEGAPRANTRAVWTGLARLGQALPDLPPIPFDLGGDKFIHVMIYFAPGFFLTLSAQARGLSRRRHALAAWACAGAVGVIDELSQALAGRDGELGDVVANAVGAGAGGALAWALGRAWRAHRRRRASQVKASQA